MSTLGNIYDPHSGVSRSFLRGLEKLSIRDLESAWILFREAEESATEKDTYIYTYMSYHGMVACQLGELDGLDRCRHAAHFEQFDGDVFHNLAISELRHGNRRHAIEAIRTGLRIDPDNQKLERLRERIGSRRRPVLGFLSRDNFLNRILGKLTWRLTHRHSRVS
jgi:hypothetical protein